MMWLHVATTALFVVAGVLSSYFLGESVIWLTGSMALGWVGAAIYRYR
jgi:hypothetical protein